MLSPEFAPRLDRHVEGYVADGRIPGGLTLVGRGGAVVHLATCGLADRERSAPVREDTIFRIYSMTKPITSIALMQLYERGKVQLDDPVHRYIPEWEGLRVRVSGAYPDFETCEAKRAMTVRDLLSHQSGLAYGVRRDESEIDAAYAEVGTLAPDSTLAEMVTKLAELPLMFSPGRRWKYSIAADVCGYLVQQISGQPFDEYLDEHVLGPLGMADTSFWVRPEKIARFAASYEATPEGGMALVDDPRGSAYAAKPSLPSGGGGLTSTAMDYWRFAQALCNGGELDGTRIIGRKTLELMTANHLTGGVDLAAVAYGRWSETTNVGIGFGLGFAVTLDPTAAQISGTAGEFSWGGVASTMFLVDPAEELVLVFMTQLMPSYAYNLRRELRALVYGALS